MCIRDRFYTLDKAYSQAYIYKINNAATIRHNIVIENLHISFERTPSTSKVNADQNCIYMSSLENSWVKGVSMTGFIHAGIKITSTTRSTIEDCYSIDPSGLCTGGTYYNFETYHRSQLVPVSYTHLNPPFQLFFDDINSFSLFS